VGFVLVDLEQLSFIEVEDLQHMVSVAQLDVVHAPGLAMSRRCRHRMQYGSACSWSICAWRWRMRRRQMERRCNLDAVLEGRNGSLR
jgi:hypothetical protein